MRYDAGPDKIVMLVVIFDVRSRLPVRLDITSGGAHHLMVTFEEATKAAGYPGNLWVDHCHELSAELREWAEHNKVILLFGGEVRRRFLVQSLITRVIVGNSIRLVSAVESGDALG
jgi:hypothetical protein